MANSVNYVVLCDCDCVSEADSAYEVAILDDSRASGGDLFVSPLAAGTRSESGPSVVNRRGSRSRYRLVCPGSCGRKISELSGATAADALDIHQKVVLARASERNVRLEIQPPDLAVAAIEEIAGELVSEVLRKAVREVPAGVFLLESFTPSTIHGVPRYVIRFDELCRIVSRLSKRQKLP